MALSVVFSPTDMCQSFAPRPWSIWEFSLRVPMQCCGYHLRSQQQPTRATTSSRQHSWTSSGFSRRVLICCSTAGSTCDALTGWSWWPLFEAGFFAQWGWLADFGTTTHPGSWWFPVWLVWDFHWRLRAPASWCLASTCFSTGETQKHGRFARDRYLPDQSWPWEAITIGLSTDSGVSVWCFCIWQHAKFDRTKQPICQCCLQPDTQLHWLACPRFGPQRLECGDDFGWIASVPSCVVQHLLAPRSPFVLPLKRYFMEIQDASCLFESTPRWGDIMDRAAWATVNASAGLSQSWTSSGIAPNHCELNFGASFPPSNGRSSMAWTSSCGLIHQALGEKRPVFKTTLNYATCLVTMQISGFGSSRP